MVYAIFRFVRQPKVETKQERYFNWRESFWEFTYGWQVEFNGFFSPFSEIETDLKFFPR